MKDGCQRGVNVSNPVQHLLSGGDEASIGGEGREGRRRAWYGSESQVVRFLLKGCGRGIVVNQKRYESTACCLRMTRLGWAQKGRWMKV